MEQKKRSRDPEGEGILRALISDDLILNTPERVLSMKKIPETKTGDGYTTASALYQVYRVLNSMIASGIDLPERSEEWLVSRLRFLYAMFGEYVASRYRSIRGYDLTGDSAKWNDVSLCFHIQNSILVVLDKVTQGKHMPPLNAKELADRELLVLPKKNMRDYTQMELYLAVSCVASRWNIITYCDSLPLLLYHLHLRTAYLCVERNQSHVMDGRDGKDKLHSASIKPKINPNDKALRKEYSCSADFISDLACMISSMRVSLYNRNLATHDFVELSERGEWEGYSPEKVVKGFKEWIVNEAKHLESVSFKNDARKSILLMAAMRPGDYERYMRDHAGRSVEDANAIVEHVRPPVSASWWSSQSARGGIPKLIRDEDPLFRSIAILKTFHQCCNTKAHFQWWALCFIQDKEIPSRLDHMRVQREPIVLKQMGEFNVWYKQKIYRTVSVERALVMWTITMVAHMDCEFTDPKFDRIRLPFLRSMLETWNGGKLENERVYEPLFDDLPQPMQCDDVFCEVLDSLYVQS